MRACPEVGPRPSGHPEQILHVWKTPEGRPRVRCRRAIHHHPPASGRARGGSLSRHIVTFRYDGVVFKSVRKEMKTVGDLKKLLATQRDDLLVALIDSSEHHVEYWSGRAELDRFSD